MTFPQLLLLVSVLSLIALLVWQKRERRRMDEIATLARAGGPYHCVAIRSRGVVCVAARTLVGKRLLSSEAPTLPVPGCTAANCRCSYVHYDDRRADDRREIYRSRQLHDDLRPERRMRKDRRRDPRLRTSEAV
ncbi:MAG: hypothetical protein WCF44_12035 [Candidatus Methylophosphatis roskildensis]